MNNLFEASCNLTVHTITPLTPTEKRICELLVRGNTRPDLRRLLGVNENCLKWHLKQLYGKTIGDNPHERDKLHRLTQFLYRLREGENYP